MGDSLPGELRRLVRLSAALAAGDRERLRRALEDAAAGADPEAVEECLVQSYLFLGFPAALNGLALWREVSGRPAPPPLEEDPREWEARGGEVCARVYGDRYPALRRNIAGLHPDMDRWMVLEGYGKVLGRPGLPLRERELCIVAMLAAVDAPVQLHSHVLGALRVGAEPAEVEGVLAEVRPMLSGERRERVEDVWRRARRRTDPDREPPVG
jgi:4-carboxymuconolactone decarboxylase